MTYLRLTLILAFLLPWAFALGNPVSEKDTEIQYLIEYVAHSHAVFLRNGKEYTAQEGADHLRSKWGKAGDRVKTAEDFIAGVASKSYLSGKPYQVRLQGEKEQPTGPWLGKALQEYRVSHAAKK